jgi:hypothetical protein
VTSAVSGILSNNYLFCNRNDFVRAISFFACSSPA